MNNSDFAMLLIAVFGLVGMTWGIISSILNHKSIPVSEVDALLARVYEMAQNTPSKLDDKAVATAKTLWQGAKDLGVIQSVSAPAPVTVTTTTTTTETEQEAVG